MASCLCVNRFWFRPSSGNFMQPLSIFRLTQNRSNCMIFTQLLSFGCCWTASGKIVNLEGLSMASEAQILANRRTPRLLPLPPQGQACCAPRNDGKDRANYAKQSQFVVAWICCKAFVGKGLCEFWPAFRSCKTKPSCWACACPRSLGNHWGVAPTGVRGLVAAKGSRR